MSFGTYIRRLRESTGVPLNWFAAQIGLSPAYWSRIERDMEKPPKNEILLKTSVMLDASPDDVFIAAGRLPPDIQADIRSAVQIYRAQERNC